MPLELESVQRRAAAIQRRHQSILDDTVAKVNRARTVEGKKKALRSGAEAVAFLRHEHWEGEVQASGGSLSVPAGLNVNNPAHALVLLVRNDLADTERKLDLLKNSVELGRRIEALKVTAIEAVGETVKETAKAAGSGFGRVAAILSAVGAAAGALYIWINWRLIAPRRKGGRK